MSSTILAMENKREQRESEASFWTMGHACNIHQKDRSPCMYSFVLFPSYLVGWALEVSGSTEVQLCILMVGVWDWHTSMTNRLAIRLLSIVELRWNFEPASDTRPRGVSVTC